MRDLNRYHTLPYNPKLRERAKELRRTSSLSEVLLWRKINRKQLNGLDFDRQKIIGNFIVDFFCAECMTAIEIDGDSHNDREEYDTERDAFLEGLDVTVIRIQAEDVLSHLDVVMAYSYSTRLFVLNVLALVQSPPWRGGAKRRGGSPWRGGCAEHVLWALTSTLPADSLGINVQITMHNVQIRARACRGELCSPAEKIL